MAKGSNFSSTLPSCLHWSSHWGMILENIELLYYWITEASAVLNVLHPSILRIITATVTVHILLPRKLKAWVSYTTRIWTQTVKIGKPCFETSLVHSFCTNLPLTSVGVKKIFLLRTQIHSPCYLCFSTQQSLSNFSPGFPQVRLSRTHMALPVITVYLKCMWHFSLYYHCLEKYIIGQRKLYLLGFILPRPLLHLTQLKNDFLDHSFLVSKCKCCAVFATLSVSANCPFINSCHF